MKKGAYAEAVNSAGYSDQARPRGACHCVGCPMPGSLTASTNGSSEWFCRLHFGAPPALWNDISARANNRAPLLQVAEDLLREAPGSQIPAWAVKTLTASKREALQLPPSQKPTAWALGRHVFSVLEHEVKHPELQPQMAEPLIIDEEYHA